tara:strand:+ start:1992 stop:2117 length:126 start_codon:yes stop_codon:yes gene_type:complete
MDGSLIEDGIGLSFLSQERKTVIAYTNVTAFFKALHPSHQT